MEIAALKLRLIQLILDINHQKILEQLENDISDSDETHKTKPTTKPTISIVGLRTCIKDTTNPKSA